MTQQGKEHIAIVNAAIFVYVGVLHVLRAVFNLDLTIGSVTIAAWVSVLPALGAFVLVYFNMKSIHVWSKATWLKFIVALLVLDAAVVLYSWLANLSYWGISNMGFGVIFVVEFLVIIALAMYIRKRNASR